MAKYPKRYPAPLPPLPPLRKPCNTARRLAMLKRLCAGATCVTTRRMVERCKALWWAGGEAGGADVKLRTASPAALITRR
jgi:peptidoglycan/xylan/chitin deacetylase (PgdA/CDA1 family)